METWQSWSAAAAATTAESAGTAGWGETAGDMPKTQLSGTVEQPGWKLLISVWCCHWPWYLGRLRSSCEIIFITLDWRLYSKKLGYRIKVILQDPVHSARLRPWPIKNFGIWQKLSVGLSCELDSSLNILSSHFELVKERSSGTERQQRPKFLIVLSLNLAKWALNSDIQVILWEKDNLARLS